MRHLDENQRYLISKLLQEHRMQSEIARIIDVDRSTVSREIRRNTVNGKYRPKTAEILSVSRWHECHKYYKYGQQTWDEVSDDYSGVL